MWWDKAVQTTPWGVATDTLTPTCAKCELYTDKGDPTVGLAPHSPLLLICIGIKVASWEHENYGGNIKCLLLDLMKNRKNLIKSLKQQYKKDRGFLFSKEETPQKYELEILKPATSLNKTTLVTFIWPLVRKSLMILERYPTKEKFRERISRNF